MYSSSFLSSSGQIFAKETAELGQVLLGRARLERRDLAHGLQSISQSLAVLLRQVMRQRPGLGIIRRSQRGLEQERLGLGHRALARNLDRVHVGAVDLARERIVELAQRGHVQRVDRGHAAPDNPFLGS